MPWKSIAPTQFIADADLRKSIATIRLSLLQTQIQQIMTLRAEQSPAWKSSHTHTTTPLAARAQAARARARAQAQEAARLRPQDHACVFDARAGKCLSAGTKPMRKNFHACAPAAHLVLVQSDAHKAELEQHPAPQQPRRTNKTKQSRLEHTALRAPPATVALSGAGAGPTQRTNACTRPD
jgi:hypothetical protein